MITVEPEWDDETRGRAEALADYIRSLCPCGCGQPMSESHQKTPYLVDTFTCYAGRAVEKKRRIDTDDAEATKRPAGWDDGLHYFARPVNPERDLPTTPTTRRGTT